MLAFATSPTTANKLQSGKLPKLNQGNNKIKTSQPNQTKCLLLNNKTEIPPPNRSRNKNRNSESKQSMIMCLKSLITIINPFMRV